MVSFLEGFHCSLASNGMSMTKKFQKFILNLQSPVCLEKHWNLVGLIIQMANNYTFVFIIYIQVVLFPYNIKSHEALLNFYFFKFGDIILLLCQT